MSASSSRWRVWLSASRHDAMLLGLAMIALIWGSVAYHLDVERTRARQSAVQNTGNLARSFEEYTARSRKEVDKSLLLLRTAFEKNPEHPNWQWQSMMSNDRAKDEINPSASMRTNRAPS